MPAYFASAIDQSVGRFVGVTGHASLVRPLSGERLEQARDELVELSLTPDASGDHVTDAAAGLVDVVGALGQLGDTDFIQSCSGTFDPGVEVHVTVDSTNASDGTRLWVLDCA